MAEICVIVPVYNVEPYLRRCVDSLLSQTYSDFDLILIDDGSTDRCDVLCDEYAIKEPRIKVIHQENGGLSAARNTGIDWAFDFSESKWICFIDSDDWVHPLFLELLYRALKDNSTTISISGYLITSGEDFPAQNGTQIFRCETKDFYKDHNVNATVAWGKLFEKECFRNMRFPVGKIHEDEYIIYQILFQNKYVSYIDQPLYAYFQNNEGITRKPWNPQRLDCFDALDEQVAFFLRKGYLDIARMRFDSIINNCLRFFELISESSTLSAAEKGKCHRIVQKRLRTTLSKYAKYKWVSIWRRGNDLWIYANAYPAIMLMLIICRTIKSRLKHICCHALV